MRVRERGKEIEMSRERREREERRESKERDLRTIWIYEWTVKLTIKLVKVICITV